MIYGDIWIFTIHTRTHTHTYTYTYTYYMCIYIYMYIQRVQYVFYLGLIVLQDFRGLHVPHLLPDLRLVCRIHRRSPDESGKIQGRDGQGTLHKRPQSSQTQWSSILHFESKTWGCFFRTKIIRTQKKSSEMSFLFTGHHFGRFQCWAQGEASPLTWSQVKGRHKLQIIPPEVKLFWMYCCIWG